MFAALQFSVVFRLVLPYLIVVISVVSLLWWIYHKGYNNGVLDTETRYQIIIQKERHRQLEANSAAIEEARRKLADLERLLGERDKIISELLEESDTDPNANRPAIGTSSVRRINRIR